MPPSLTNKYSDDILSGYTYEYSLDGNRIGEVSSDGITKSYTYDKLGRLTSETHTGQGVNNEYAYSYDRFGNRSSAAINGKTTTYEYDLNNRLIAQISEDTGIYYNYDNNGNQILSRSFELGTGKNDSLSAVDDYSDYMVYDYDLNNRLVGITDGFESTYSYTYHADGLRKTKTVNNNTTEYSWNNGNMVLETDSSGTTIYEYDINGVSRRIKNESSDYYLKNGHTDVVGLYNENGEQISTYTYDAFGNQLNTNISDTNPFRYCGEYYDQETENIYLRNRYYDASIGRFTTEDPIKDGINWYVYANNNPVNYIDPSGLFYDEVIQALQTIIDNKSRMTSPGTPKHEYWTAYSNILVAKEQIANDVIYVENWTGVTDILSPLINGDNNSLQSIKNMKVAVDRAKKDNEKSHLLTDASFYGAFVGGAVVIKSGVAVAAGKIITGASASAPMGFETFSQLKKYLGSPGVGYHWHHVVEQCQITKSGFAENMIHSTYNVYAVSADIHSKITGYYGSVQDFTNGLKVRDWLAGQSFETQYNFGINVLKAFGVIK